MAIKNTDPPEYDFFTVCCACGAKHPMKKRRKGLPKPFYGCPVCLHATCGACGQKAVKKGGPDQKASPPSGELTMDSIKKRILEMEDELRREEDAKRKALREAIQRKSKKEWDYPWRGWPETNEPQKKRRKPSDEGGGKRRAPAEDGVGRSVRIIQRGLRDELLSD